MAYSPIVELFRKSMSSAARCEQLRSLIAAGAPLDAPTDHPSKKTPLQLAVSSKVSDERGIWRYSAAIVDELLMLGAKVDVLHAKSGMQAIHYAARFGSVEAVLSLIKAGADPNATDDVGERPIFMCLERQAVDEERFPVFCALLAGGADPNLKSGSGRTLLQAVKDEKFTRETRRAMLEWSIHGGAPFERSREGEPSGDSSFSGMQPL